MRYYVRTSTGDTHDVGSFDVGVISLISDDGYRLTVTDECYELIIRRQGELSEGMLPSEQTFIAEITVRTRS